jgi:predicted acyl esterase
VISRRFFAAIGLFFVSACSPAGRDDVDARAGAEGDGGRYAIVVEKNVEAAMRDGVILRADVYRPDAPGRFPAILRRTPYSKNVAGINERLRDLASKGFVAIAQDTRGRYASEGVAVPHDEAADGYDTVEWVAGLPYVNGRVGMFGSSYVATTQLTAAGQAPPSLVAIAPSSSYTSRYDMVYQGGAFYLTDGLGWNLGQAADVRRRRNGATFEERDGPITLTSEERAELRASWAWHMISGSGTNTSRRPRCTRPGGTTRSSRARWRTSAVCAPGPLPRGRATDSAS